MKTYLSATSAVALAAVIFGSGCVSWYSVPEQAPVRAVRKADPRTSLSIRVTFRSSFSGVKAETERKAASEIDAIVHEVFADSRHYVLVNDPAAAQYRLGVAVLNHADPNIALAVLCGLTLGVIPAYAHDEYVTTVSVQAQNGKLIGQHRIEHSLSTLIQILLLPATPFAYTAGIAQDMLSDVSGQVLAWTDQTIAEHSAQAALPSPPKPSLQPPPAPPEPAPEVTPEPAAPPPPPQAPVPAPAGDEAPAGSDQRLDAS